MTAGHVRSESLSLDRVATDDLNLLQAYLEDISRSPIIVRGRYNCGKRRVGFVRDRAAFCGVTGDYARAAVTIEGGYSGILKS